ncbi:MAG: flagellar protein [Stygiobacter sp. RIFOXYC12_FULL_38_8]|nr:MAG: flagellar protein [Stygiobacter sp. GWC2_38_9]OGU77163.1 MAG: flagellar protein [Stygiobacter sp. RIFOXYA12_FULL_38_9]OGV07963.1 MAG: flagellar protein [Stygiobacter sp. RIFOXYB2_FULL_37_11]OGV11115.1 MAG: flagellar protein [Stygiobacter sp. RIFOXYA2_FULL_38_8]OGV14239.1 MAG: flagellar protein [Stygiobacter sp. RIFOXYC2_FULL_38_25]OGV26310.1 MAG: flagellar protein [Stygiobacter sp. RIFOXYC12_FULL_38_8]OGV82483.1 MAG: flagellar protein [Stygiobacter sp. GWF2_38_21]
MAEINGISVPFIPIVGNEEIVTRRTGRETANQFDAIFKEELEKIKFSNHAMKRLESRNIQLSETELGKIKDAVSKAESKGSKDSLIMMDKTAFIVNIPNKTVVTAIEVANSNESVFTNIDSVVFAL